MGIWCFLLTQPPLFRGVGGPAPFVFTGFSFLYVFYYNFSPQSQLAPAEFSLSLPIFSEHTALGLGA